MINLKKRRENDVEIKRLSKWVLMAVLLWGPLVFPASSAWADPTVSQGSAHATIIKPLTLDCNDSLEFGEFSFMGTNPSITVNAHNTTTPFTFTGDIIFFQDPNNGLCLVTGEPNKKWLANIPVNVIQLTGPFGSMPLNVSLSLIAEPFPNLDANGDGHVAIGGTLNLTKPGQMPGGYWGTYTVVIIYG